MAHIFVSTFPFCRLETTALDLLQKNGHSVTINPLGRKMKPTEVAELAKEADAIIAGTEDLTPLVETSQKLRLISRVGVGLDSVPLELCQSKGIAVAYTPDAVSPAVSELALGMILDLFRKVTYADKEIRRKEWTRPYGQRIGTSKIGILGLGRIGTRLAKHLLGFHPPQILIHDTADKSSTIAELQFFADSLVQFERYAKTKILAVDFATLLKESDCISIHVPKTKDTIGMIGANELSLMKPSAYLVNTARGGIADEKALYDALLSKVIAGAGVDVFDEEPYKGAFLELENILLTQHMGSCSDDCRADMELEATEDTIRFFAGESLRSPVV